jgi:NAD(P)-dependent dehydrogenase (short-subunit alcohol dehydrogenase family)
MTDPVLVVGARSGLGAALTQLYRERSRTVLTLDRDRCDLGDAGAVARVAGEWTTPLALCLFCAGSAEFGYVDSLDASALRRSLEVNFLGPVALFSAWAGRGLCRRFVFVLSGTADLLLPGLGPYALAKRALRDYLYLLRAEASWPDVHVLEVWPGAMETPFDDKARVHGRFQPPRRRSRRAPEEVARRIVRAEETGRDRLMLSPLPRWLGRVQATAPDLAARLMRAHPRLRRPRSS